MGLRLYISILFLFNTFFVKSLYSQCTINQLNNPGFETPVQPLVGDNATGSSTFNGWVMPGGSHFNIVKTDGSVYDEGPDTAADGTQYAEVAKNNDYIQQNFTLTCSSDINFSGFFSIRELGGSGFNSYIDIINSSSTVVATSTVLTYVGNENQKVWSQVTGSANLPAGNYTFRFYVDNFANCDAGFLCFIPNCVLPVKINLFQGSVANCTSKINWTSQSEINLKAYQVEYSTNGTDFTTLGTVNAANNTSASNNYEFVQPAAVSGIGIYRLKMIDNDGKYKYSDRIVLNVNCSGNDVLIYPNPTKEFINVSILNPAVSYTATAKLYNVSGQLVINKTVKNGSNKIDIKTLSAGAYYLVIADAEENKKYKIVKE
ncbi:T9SS type A sorting domain-containing protein [Ferruginibacter sp.]